MSTLVPSLVTSQNEPPEFGAAGVLAALDQLQRPVWIVARDEQGGRRLGVGFDGTLAPDRTEGGYPIHALLPPLHAEWLGDRGFCEEHGTRYASVCGAMATGIASVELVVAAARAGFLAFYGAGGQSLSVVE